MIAILASALTAAVLLVAGAAVASAPWLKETKDAGLPAQNCQYCHTAAVPLKDTFKPEDLNDRGKWLLAEKARRQATETNPVWLKEYPGGSEQK